MHGLLLRPCTHALGPAASGSCSGTGRPFFLLVGVGSITPAFAKPMQAHLSGNLVVNGCSSMLYMSALADSSWDAASVPVSALT